MKTSTKRSLAAVPLILMILACGNPQDGGSSEKRSTQAEKGTRENPIGVRVYGERCRVRHQWAVDSKGRKMICRKSGPGIMSSAKRWRWPND